ncbi:spermidine synthase [Sulfurivirga sp.]|uniref:spermidine synthase n=1 Tax=Sulfurivirga sp. TaxID=2614236 RepID=UPI0025DF6266|nr:fused MFS/spermidine synthase [Sulfurivirga sp.]
MNPCVYAVRDGRGLIQVREDRQHTVRTLHFGNHIEQSRYYLNAPFTLGFEYFEVAFRRLTALVPASLLSLGLGGGRLNTQLFYTLPQCRQTIVELRPAVTQVARDWFDLPEKLNIVHEDAFHYMTLQGDRHDALFVDLFDDKGMPVQFASDVFIDALLDALNPGGRALINLWRDDPTVRYVLLPWLRRRNDLELTLHPMRSSPNWIAEIHLK